MEPEGITKQPKAKRRKISHSLDQTDRDAELEEIGVDGAVYTDPKFGLGNDNEDSEAEDEPPPQASIGRKGGADSGNQRSWSNRTGNFGKEKTDGDRNEPPDRVKFTTRMREDVNALLRLTDFRPLLNGEFGQSGFRLLRTGSAMRPVRVLEPTQTMEWRGLLPAGHMGIPDYLRTVFELSRIAEFV